MQMRTLMMSLFVFTLVVLTGGCVKYKQIVTVMPDGSGKVQYIVGFSQAMLQMAEGEENPLDQYTPESMGEQSKGLVAFTDPVRYEEGGYSYVAFAGYFPSINDLELPGPENGETAMTFNFVAADGGATLTVLGGTVLGMAREFEQPEAEERQLLEQDMLKGLEIVERYVLPGDAEAIEGVTLVDNTAELKIDVDAMLDNTGPLPAMKGQESYTLEIPELSITQDQIDAFKVEMAEAIDQWNRMNGDGQ